MKVLTRYPLYITIPAVLVLFSTFASIWIGADTLYRERSEIEREIMEQVRLDMTSLQTSISDFIVEGNKEGARRMMTMHSSNKDLNALLLSDGDDNVVMSTRFEWIGRKVSETVSNYDLSKALMIRGSSQGDITLTPDRMSVIGYFPVDTAMSKGDLRPSNMGVLFVDHDLSKLKTEAGRKAIAVAIKLWLPFAALIPALWGLLHILITTRLSSLVSQTEKMAAGDMRAMPGIEGSDEIAALGRSLNGMAANIAEGQMTLLAEVSAKELAEEELGKFMWAIEQTGDTVVITDPKGNIEYVNPNFCKTTGYSREEAMGQNPRILKSGDMDPDEYKKMWDTIASGSDWHGVFLNKRKDGTLYWESAAISPIKNDKGEITNFVAVKQDITERMKYEEELKKKERLSILGQTIGSIAHDLRNPLNTINLAAEVLSMHMPDDSDNKIGKECIETIKTEIMECEGIISSLLDSVRTKTPKLMSIPAARILDMSLNRCEMPQNVSLTTDIHPSMPDLLVDPLHIRQVLINLINNALQAMPDGGSLKISVYMDGEFIKIDISDTGGGIPAENLERLFQPLFTTKKEGTGLGLIVVKNLTEASGGTVEVKSEIGKGTTFTLKFPVHSSME